MELGTKFLFNLLLRFVKPDLVCDVGAMDGSDAMRFKKMLPSSKVVLFEANKTNYEWIKNNPEIQHKEIQAFNQIVSNTDGIKIFHTVKASDTEGVNQHLQGMSSVLERNDDARLADRVELSSVRLDSKIKTLGDFSCIALWVDVEGATYEVLEGLSGIKDRVKIIHAEVETEEIWQGQKLKQDVEKLADSLGFSVLAHGRNPVQHDIVLMEKSFLEQSSFMVKLCVWGAFIRTLRLKRVPTYLKTMFK